MSVYIKDVIVITNNNDLGFTGNVLSNMMNIYISNLLLSDPQLTDTGTLPWVRGPVMNGEKIEVIASQMILPKATVLGGCTVVSYYQKLLQKAAEYEPGCAESSKLCRPQLMLLIPHRSPAGSFGQDASGFGSLLLQRYYYFFNIFLGSVFFP